MIPNGGIYLIFHIIVIGIVKAVKVVKERTVPTIIILSVVTITSYGMVKAVQGSLNERSNVHYYKSMLTSCEPYVKEEKTKKIVFRIDDIQAHPPWKDAQFSILEELKSRDIPALLSVIPLNLNDDKEVMHYLKNNNCKFEIGLHGWENHRDGDYSLSEFGLLTKDEARARIDLGLAVLKEIEEEPIVTFIPPNNEYSYGTKGALIDAGFKVITSEGKKIFDYSATTYNFNTKKFTPEYEVLNKCWLDLEARDLCIIMVHPQDYYTDNLFDGDKYNTFIDILDSLEEFNAEFTTLSELQNWSNIKL